MNHVAPQPGEGHPGDAYHATRLPPDQRRETLWQTLWQAYFSRLVRPDDCVLDLGCGHGSFINNVVARRRIGLDAWPGSAAMLQPDVEPITGNAGALTMLATGSVDFAFASNLFEHLTQPDFAAALAGLRRVLAATGQLCIVQPNYRYAYREYFDDYTHLTAWSHVSLCDFLTINGFEIIEAVPRFLPLTVKSRMPVSPWLIRAYLASPVKPLAKQMLVRARVRR